MIEFENLKKLLCRDRSIRRFDESRHVTASQLEKLVELTRYCASGRNLQPLKYRPVTSEEEKEHIYPLLAWAGYMPEWDGPEPGQRPAAYLIQCLDTRITKNCLCDDGLQLQAITLGATSLGIGACIIKSFKNDSLRETLRIPEWAEILYVVALGYPAEKVVIEDMNEDVKYYRSKDDVHHVPKRRLNELIL